MTLRIIAGQRRGAILATPKGEATRPTLGRVRESLFMILNPWLPDARVLDGFAGSGALALEALSRGAAEAVLVEQARPALDAIRANIAKLRWEDRARIIARDALACLGDANPPGGAAFDLILLDPPYGQELCHKAMEKLGARAEAWLAQEGLVVAQHGKHDAMQAAYGPLALSRRKEYGETVVSFYQRAQETAEEDGGE